MNRKIRLRLAVAALAAAVAAAAVALGTPGTASAADSFHQHLWRYVVPSQVTKCWDNSWDPYSSSASSVSMFWPDYVTAPVGTQYWQQVHLLAELQYYDFGTKSWTSARDGYGQVVYSRWYYMKANSAGPAVQSWFEYGTDRYAPSKLSFDVVHGNYYRIKVWYHWLDGTWQYDETNFCYA